MSDFITWANGGTDTPICVHGQPLCAHGECGSRCPFCIMNITNITPITDDEMKVAVETGELKGPVVDSVIAELHFLRRLRDRTK